MNIRKRGRNLALVLCLILVGQALIIPIFSIDISASPPIDETEGAPYVIDVYYQDATGVAVDGNLSESVWNDVDTTMTFTEVGGGYNLTIRVFHNTSYLFVGVELLGDGDSNPNDFAELSFDVEHNMVTPPEVSDFKVMAENTASGNQEYSLFNGTGVTWVEFANESGGWPADYLANATIVDLNATYEFQIPVADAWGDPAPPDGNITGFSAHAFGQSNPFPNVWWPDEWENSNNPDPEYCENASWYGDLIFRTNPSIGDTILVYGDTNSDTYNTTWNGTNWQWTPDTLLDNYADRPNWVVVENSPVRYEAINVVSTRADTLHARVFDGLAQSWGATQNLGTPVDGRRGRAIDISYEQVSGDGIVFYSLSSNPMQLNTFIWDGGAWASGPSHTFTTITNAIHFIDAESSPFGDEIVIGVSSNTNAFMNGNHDIAAVVWDGAGFANEQSMENNGPYNPREVMPFDLVYESRSGEAAMFFYGSAATENLSVRVWNGIAWSAETNSGAHLGGGEVGNWVTAKADPDSNEIVIATISDSNDVYSIFWDPAGGFTGGVNHATGWTERSRSVDAIYEKGPGHAGHVILAYGQDPDNGIHYKHWNGIAWGARITIPAGTMLEPTIIQLRRDYDGLVFMAATDNQNQELETYTWNNTGWELRKNHGQIADRRTECFWIAPALSVQKAGTLDHINLTVMYTYPAGNPIAGGNTIVGYTAVGWNDAAETEKNYTWTPTWGTTDGLGTPGNFGGNAVAGFTADYTAGIIQGYDNITVANTTTGKTNQSSILVYSNPLDHIELTPIFTFPGAGPVLAGGTIVGYNAIGWNDAAETEKNNSWVPVWDTTPDLGYPINPGGDWNAGFTVDYQANLTAGYDNITVRDNLVALVNNASQIEVIANQLDHINIMVWNVYPANESVVVGGTTSTYTAIGWNDAAELEKNLTWTPTWSTTDGLGTPGNFGGNAIAGFTADYTAGLIAGYDNLTVTDVPSATSNQSCIRIFNNAPLQHINLTPMFAFPAANDIGAGQTIVGYTAVGWNDAAETDKNTTWAPNWGTTNGLGTPGNLGGNAVAGFTVDYTAGGVPGFDNITVTDTVVSISNQSVIRIINGTPATISYVSGSGQHKLPMETIDSPFIVLVEDAFGNPIPNFRVDWAINGTPGAAVGQSLSVLTNNTNSTGQAGTVLTLGNALGEYYVNATNSSFVLAGEPVTFVAEARPPPHHINIVSGDAQNGTAGTTLALPLIVNVTYDDNSPVGPGIPVWFNITAGGGWLGANNTVTNASGMAQTILMLGNNAGSMIIKAEISSAGTDSVSFFANATLPDIASRLSANATTVVAGNFFSYILSFDNNGTEDAAHAWINMTLDLNLLYQADTSPISPDVNSNDYSWYYSPLSVGPHSFSVFLRASPSTPNGTVISNFFTVDYIDQAGNFRPIVTSNVERITIIEFDENIIANEPPTIDGVPDLIVHHDWDYRIDLSPYIDDPDDEPENLTLILSDLTNVRVDPFNNLAIILNYSISYLGTTQMLNITVTDGYGSDWDMTSVRITEDFPPEVIAKIPDVTLYEDMVSYPFNISEYFWDRDGDALYYTYGEKNVNITFLWNNTVEITPKPDWFGIEKVTFRASDPTGALIEDTINITVLPVNDPPVIGDIDDQIGEVGVSWILDLADYDLRDVDNLLSELNITTDSPDVTVNGLNLTFRFSSPVELEIITITISDGQAEIFSQINVVVTGSGTFDELMPFIIPIIIILSVLFIIIAVLKRRFIVEQAFLIYKDGSLIAHASNRIIQDMDADIFTGMLTAIQDFVKDSFKDEKDASLKKVEFGESKMFFKRGPLGNVSLALVYKGSDGSVSHFADNLMKDLADNYQEAFIDWDGNLGKMSGARDILLKHFDR